MELYFIRHGQSENNLLWAQTGSSEGRREDPGLTQAGRRQAHRVAEFLGQGDITVKEPLTDWDPQNVTGFRITHLYSSLMLRAVMTGDIVARELDLPLMGWPDLHESGGIYQKDEVSGERIGLPGKNRAYFEAHFPNLILPNDLGTEGWWNRPFEAHEDRSLRARRVLEGLLERHGGTENRVAVVSHGGFYNWLLRAVLGLPVESERWFALNNAAVTRINFNEDSVVLAYMNRADHLMPDLIT